jgi:argininosuccinate synthase
VSSSYKTREVTAEKVENKIAYHKKKKKQWSVKTNIFARKSENGPLPYCNTGTKSDGFNFKVPLLTKFIHIPLGWYINHLSASLCRWAML